MTQLTTSAERSDPYRNFKFRVKWDGRYVAGVSQIGALRLGTEEVEDREGGDPGTVRTSPWQTRFETITLERGATHDSEFEKWVDRVWNFGGGPGSGVAPRDLRKNVVIEMYDESGQLAFSYNVYRRWASDDHALPEADAGADAGAIQTLELQHEGSELDPAATAAAE
jgi:phage tail-like protein